MLSSADDTAPVDAAGPDAACPDAAADAVPPVYERVIAVVREIPYGKVATYGQIALIVGDGCTARMVGYCMASLGPDSGVPWQRVINRQGRISPRGAGMGALLQRERLLEEGVEFSDADRISFRRFGWLDPY